MFNEGPISLREAVHRVLLAAAAGLLVAPLMASAAELPVPCAAGTCNMTGPNGNLHVGPSWITSGNATWGVSGNALTVNQTTDRAILNWQSFNVGADGQVIFNQPGRSSIALNRIYQNSPSRIFGQVSANGEIYLVNPNGIVFGRTAKIDVAGILATTLDISDSNFETGIAAASLVRNEVAALDATNSTNFDRRVSVLNERGEPVRGTIGADGTIQEDPSGEPIKVQLIVQQGAQIATSGANGRILLAAQNVDNSGSITANDGQAILAAGESVYLQTGGDASLRGLTVEVKAGGTVWNRLAGQISTPRGNATLVGFAVNQDGRISATTSVAANGSIRLLARDGANVGFGNNGPQLQATRSGTLQFGSNSVTSIVPELQDTATAVDDQVQNPSHIEAMGRQVTIRSGSVLRANGGRIDVSAVVDPSGGALDATDVKDGKVIDPETFPTPLDGQSQLRVESGALIDVSGSDATLPMSRNLLSVELRGSELADSPNQRDSAIRGRSVVIDARAGTPLADVQGAIAAIPKSIAERTSRGGSVVFVSDGDVVANAGSTFNVSGGTLTYERGLVATTQLIGADGKIYDIGSADPARTYVGLINPTYRRVDDRWGQVEVIRAPGIGRIEAGYTEGQAAGTLQFIAPTMLLNGTFVGNSHAGPYQRNPGKIPIGGSLILGIAGGIGHTPANDYRAPSVVFTDTLPSAVVADGAALPSGQPLQLPIDYLLNGFTRTEIYSNGTVTVPADNPLQLSPGSIFRASGQTVRVLADITNSGGEISLTSHDPAARPTALQPGIEVGKGVTLDVRGLWTNDSLLPPGSRPNDPLLRNGGSINLTVGGKGFDSGGASRPGSLSLGDNVRLLANGGASVSAAGAVAPGAGGAIALLTNGLNSQINIGANVGLEAFGALGAQGGTFSLTAPKIAVSGGSSWAASQAYDPAKPFLELGTALFSDYGFSTIKLVAAGLRDTTDDPDTDDEGDVLRIVPETHLNVGVKSLQLDAQAGRRANNANIAEFSQVVVPQPNKRATANVSFAASLSSATTATSTSAGDLRVGVGAELTGDVGTRFTFSSLGNAFIDGIVRAPGGSITAGVGTPTVDLDGGFIAQQRLQVGSSAVLDVSGTTVFTPNDAFIFGNVLNGGSINLLSDRGSVLVASGARLDVSGSSAILDVATGDASHPYDRRSVASSGGSLSIRAPESIGLYGDVRAFAGTGDVGHATAGSLSVELTRQHGFGASTTLGTFPTGPRVIDVSVGEVAGSALPENGLARISQDFIASSGIDSLSLRADGEIKLRSGVDLTLARQLTLDTPTLSVSGSGAVNLAADYVAIGNSLQTDAPATPVAGSGTLNVRGAFIEVIGSSVLNSVAQATLHSTGDIRLRGTVRSVGTERPVIGDLTTAGDLALDAARIYGATATQFALRAGNGTNGRIDISQNGASPGTPLSVGSSIRLVAPEIVQGGTLLAPFGSISLEGSTSVTLLDGSLTSVSGAGMLLPYGRVAIGEWTYVNAGVPTPIDELPPREVSISSNSVAIAPAATVDVSGGGDLYAYEWVPGTGGSRDALAPGTIPGLYAILPSLQGQYAPYDPQEYTNSDLVPGASIYLSGLGDLPAGVYPLLPARYSLLPGAYLVSAVAGTNGIVPGSVASLRDGTRVIAGYTTFGNTGLGDTQYSGFAVRPGSYGRALAAYDDFKASSFFAARAERLASGRVALPVDAGSLSLFAGTQLDARGKVLTQAASSDGRAATIDVSALRLAVVNGPAQANSPDVQISADQLAQWNPGTLILGGHVVAGSDQFAVTADRVTVRDGVNLRLDQIVMAAHDQVALESGATVGSRIAADAKAGPQLGATPFSLALSGGDAGSAVVSVSDLAQISVSRSGTAPRNASVDLQAGATLASRGAIGIDAPLGGALLGNVSATGARVSLAADRIEFGSSPSAGSMVIDTGLESSFQHLAALQLSAGTLDFTRDVAIDLTATPASAIELRSGSFNAIGAGRSVLFAAQEMMLAGAAGPAGATPPAAGNGQLRLTAGTLEVGPGTIDISGFAKSMWTATRQVIGTGSSRTRLSGDLEIDTPTIALASDASTAIDVLNGSASLVKPQQASDQQPLLALGGAFSLTANRIEDSIAILAPSGLVSLLSRGDLLLKDTASIDVAGRLVSAGGRQEGSHGGSIRLESGGALSADKGSKVALSGAGDSDAGRLNVQARGTASFDATLSASAATNAAGGSFELYAGQLNDFGGLAAQLQSGGFTAEQRIRVASGDLLLGAGAQMSAQSVDLVADAGAVRVAGTITAAGSDRRSAIRLYGANGVELSSTGQLHADAGAGTTRGGSIEIGSSTGLVELAPGSVITATGPASNGSLLIRTPLNDTGTDMLVDGHGADVSGVGTVILAPIFAFDFASDTATEADFADALAKANAFVAAAATNTVGGFVTPVALRPDIELRHRGLNELALDSLDLSLWHIGGQPASLTVRSEGGLQVLGTISDGFVAVSSSRLDLAADPSASVTLVAGADLNSADPGATVLGGAGDLTLVAGAIVRSGTGALTLNAASNVVFGEGASVYTGGLKGADSRVLLGSLVSFPDRGGSINVRAGGDVRGSPVQQVISNWLYRGTRPSATAAFPKLYGINAVKFGWNLGTLGGGDLTVTAGNNVSDLSAATADSAIVQPDDSIQQFGGGSMAINAGHDVNSGQFYGAQGSLRIRSDGAVGSDRLTSDGLNPLGNSLALGNARARVEARRDILLERAFNPTMVFMPGVLPANRQATFFTYGDNSSLRLQSASGNVSVAEAKDLETNFDLDVRDNTPGDALAAFSVYPSTLEALAFSGDILLNSTIYLFPGNSGQLNLFAQRDIKAGNGSGIVMSDGAANGVPTIRAPQVDPTLALAEVLRFAASSRHRDDRAPALITAGRDILGGSFSLAKAARYTAQRDIRDVTIYGQNLRPSDVTLISAGRDFAYLNDTLSQTKELSIGGPGRLDLLAGRDVDLGFTRGISTTGRGNNPSLPFAEGAGITVMAGLGEQPDYSGFIDKIVAKSSDYLAQIAGYLKGLGIAPSGDSTPLAQFQALDDDAQRPFLDAAFFNELVQSGREANTAAAAGFKRGYAAIDALFPGSGAASGDASASPYSGDLNMAFSRIYSLAGGDISLLMPGGQLNVGLANPPPNFTPRKPSELGIVAQGSGDVHIFADKDVLVNSSRVFTLLGGDIAVWSTHGNIDAGRGAKSSLSAPPPTVTFDDTGGVTVSFTGAVAGSGIRTIVTSDDVEPGDVDLIAPVGFVNAGDAGIGSSGNLNIAAQHVIGLDNIQVGGASTGVPAETGGLGASLAGVTAAASSSTNAANDAATEDEKKKDATPTLAQTALSWLDVFVLGLGEENCKQDDVECLKRQ